MYKYLFFIAILLFFFSCDKETTVNSCTTSKDCENNYKCVDKKCIPKSPITVCEAGETTACYTGGMGTRNVGACKDGVITCSSEGDWELVCKNEVKPIAEICGDNIDNDCDGHVDEDCGCTTVGEERDCYNGPIGTEGVGICRSGKEECGSNHQWTGNCVGSVTPIQNTCENKDNDCNGAIDSSENRCQVQTECNPGDQKACNTPGNNIGVGICKAGYNLCNAEGSWGTECIGEVKAEVSDTCGDGVDNNCNGNIDENCSCTPGEEKPCYTGSPNELGKGRCESGVMTCTAQGSWTNCQGEEKPIAETCDGEDNDCDGIVDNGVANACGSCGALPVETCNNIDDDCDGIVDNVLPENGGNACGTCGVVPTEVCGNGIDDDCDSIVDNPEICDQEPECVKTSETEICDNGLDDNCNGSIDDGCNCSGSIECFTGSPNSVFNAKSICKKGLSYCIAGENWGSCDNEVLPQAETCNGLDDDCDGTVDNGFSIGQPCSIGVGACKKTGTYACNDQGGVTCSDGSGNPLVAGTPSHEICDGLDNNCNGSIDEVFSLNQNCYSGLGECRKQGKTVCASNHNEVTCDATPSSGTAERCGDGLDNDCNGLIDDVPNIGLACENGVGACERTGAFYCDNATNTVKCNANPGQPVNEICGDNIDNDCDNQTDTDPELALGSSCTVGVGICQRDGGKACQNNIVICSGTPGNPDSRGEICNNGLDDDCDGDIDETPCLSTLAVSCPNPPMVRPVNPPDGYGRVFTLVNYPFTATVQGENGGASYKWELVTAPAGNQNIGQTIANSKTVSFEPLTISARESGSPLPYVLKFTATEGGESASCNVQFYALSEDFIHVELTWGNATDIDLHMLSPNAPSGAHSNWEVNGDANSYDCGYANCKNTGGLDWNKNSISSDNMQLDIDNTDGFGSSCSGSNCDKPENINVPSPRFSTDDIYRVAAFNYESSDTGSGLEIKINCLGANGLDVIKEYSRSTLSKKTWWYMSDITWMGDYCVITNFNDVWAQ